MSVKLHYFPIRGRAETSRLILEDVGAAYENVIVTNWRQVKDDSERFFFNQLPVADFGDFRLTQAKAIVRHIGRLHNLYGANAEEQSYVDMLLDGHEDFFSAYMRAIYTDRSLVDGFLAEAVPTWFARFERLLSRKNNGDAYFLGDHITIADYAFFDAFDATLHLKADALDFFPKLKGFHARVKSRPNIAAYLASARRLAPPSLN